TRHLAVEELGHRVGLRKQRHSAAIYVERSKVQHATGFGNCDPGWRPAYAYASRLRLRAQPRRSLGLFSLRREPRPGARAACPGRVPIARARWRARAARTSRDRARTRRTR